MAHHQIVILGFAQDGGPQAVVWLNGKLHHIPLYVHPERGKWALNDAELLERMGNATIAVLECLAYQVYRDPPPKPGESGEAGWWEVERARLEPTLAALRAEPNADFARVAAIAETHAGMADLVHIRGARA